MNKNINSIFEDLEIVEKIKKKLPYLFQLAEIDNSRDGKLGMEVGSARERIIIALFIYRFGLDDVQTNIPITKAETDVVVFNKPLSIKTISGSRINGVKLIWTVDPKKALEFSKTYIPSCDTILVQINWDNIGYFYLLSKEVQEEVLEKLGRKKYIKLPKQGTNPRGVELSSLAIDKLTNHPKTKKIEIFWKREDVKYIAYDRWVEYWGEE